MFLNKPEYAIKKLIYRKRIYKDVVGEIIINKHGIPLKYH